MKQVIRIGYYNKTDWKYLLEIIDDKNSLPVLWDDWHESFKNQKKDLVAKGFKVKEIKVDIEELIEYCELRKIKVDAHARSQFVNNF